MECIAAVEGIMKCMLSRLHGIHVCGVRDDTEYACNVKAVLDAVDDFFLENRDIPANSDELKLNLYEFSKKLWLDSLNRIRNTEEPEKAEPASKTDDDAYDDYCFDYIYKHGVYPR